MKRWLGRLTLLLLVLTLPLRGLAAVSACAVPAEQHQGGAVWHEVDTGKASTLQQGSVSPIHADHQPAPANKAGAICGDYSACCIGTLSDSYPSAAFAGKPVSSEIIAFLDHAYSGHIPEGPERPPRLLAH